MSRDERLRSISQSRRARRDAARIGESLLKVLEERILPERRRFEKVLDIWSRLLPVELSRHSRIVGLSGGKLKVEVEAPSYAAELRWSSSEILGQLQQECPGEKVKVIEVVLR